MPSFLPGDMTGIRYPDMMIAFDADPEAYDRSNGYIISEQGKPPDFVLEIGSPSTGRVDVEEKRDDYAALGIPEYWRFDETGRSHGARLAGDRLEGGVYRPIAIEALEEDILQGRSAVLHLDLRWEHGQLKWHDPETGRHIATYDDQAARAEGAEARAEGAEARAEGQKPVPRKRRFRPGRSGKSGLPPRPNSERSAKHEPLLRQGSGNLKHNFAARVPDRARLRNRSLRSRQRQLAAGVAGPLSQGLPNRNQHGSGVATDFPVYASRSRRGFHPDFGTRSAGG